jgi:hypothetical protein
MTEVDPLDEYDEFFRPGVLTPHWVYTKDHETMFEEAYNLGCDQLRLSDYWATWSFVQTRRTLHCNMPCVRVR